MVLEASVIVATLSAAFAGIGLFLNWWVIRESNKTRQLQLLNNVFENIKETEVTLYKDYKNASADTKKEWDSLLFNSIEWFSFLVNKRFIRNKKMAGFFDEAIVMWYEKIFLQHYNEEEVHNTRLYPEFKILYYTIKSKVH